LVWPKKKPFSDYDEGSRRTSPDVLFDMAKQGLNENSGVQAVYFQGAINSGPILERVEKELGLPVVSSGQANNWYIISKLGRRYPLSGAIRLFSEWPPLPRGK
jgi:maleate cis-trans isomerase